MVRAYVIYKIKADGDVSDVVEIVAEREKVQLTL